MKKLVIVPSVLWLCILLAGCGNKENDTETPAPVIEPETEICADNGWSLTNRAEWGDITVCAFDDNSFCFLEDLESWECEKWYIFFESEEDLDNTEATNNTVNECSEEEQNIVCWKDGNTYFNKCYLEAAWVEEETELAHVENWECIFG